MTMRNLVVGAPVAIFLSVVTAVAGAAQAPAAPAPAPSSPDSGKIVIHREVFQYGGGRRDPFVSLMSSAELRPLFSDLRLVAVVTDIGGRNSVAILRDLTTKEQYRVKSGQTLGRMRVARIEQKSVVFTIEEFGYSRQETLVMGDSTKVRTQ